VKKAAAATETMPAEKPVKAKKAAKKTAATEKK
jgi:hypothetical protein